MKTAPPDGYVVDSSSNGARPEMTRRKVVSGTSEVPRVGDTRLHDMLSIPDRTALNANGSSGTYENAEMPVFREGDPARNLYAIASGIVRICRHLDTGDRRVLSFF